MPVGVNSEFPATREQFEAVNEKLGDEVPAGVLVHTAGEITEGQWRVFDVWQSKEDYERFVQERLGPAIQEVAGDDAPEPKIEIYELHDFETA